MMFKRPIVWTPRPNAGFILPGSRYLEIEPARPAVGMTGRYKIIKHRAGTVLQETPWFDNIILDSGLNQWGTGAIILGAAIGTGTSTPAAGDVGLQTQSHWTTATGTGHGTVSAGSAPNYNNTRTYVYRTTLGALNGNYSEVGVGWASGSNMFSRALILDGVGAPTTIAVGTAEQLDIWYQHSIYPPIVDVTNNVTISGVNYTVTGRAAGVTNTSSYWSAYQDGQIRIKGGFGNGGVFSGTVGAITGTPSGTSAAQAGASGGTYTNNSLTQTGQFSAGLSEWNVGGMGAHLVLWYATPGGNTLASFQYGFSPVIPKDNTKTLVLNYSISWARLP